MTASSAIGGWVADPCREALLAVTADDRHGNNRQGANDLLPVLSFAAMALGVALLSQGALPSQVAVRRVSGEHVTRMVAESAEPASDPRLAAIMSQTVRVLATPRAASSGASTNVTACNPHLDLEQDLRLDLSAMAGHRQRFSFARERRAGSFGAPANQDVPAKYRVLAGDGASVAHVNIPPPFVRRLNAPSC